MEVSYSDSSPRRVLIISSHPLFGKGIRSLLDQRREQGIAVVGTLSSVEEALANLPALHPDLVILDTDDEQMKRDVLLVRCLDSGQRLRVVLLSLKENGGEAVVFERRTLQAAQIDEWLDAWSDYSTPDN